LRFGDRGAAGDEPDAVGRQPGLVDELAEKVDAGLGDERDGAVQPLGSNEHAPEGSPPIGKVARGDELHLCHDAMVASAAVVPRSTQGPAWQDRVAQRLPVGAVSVDGDAGGHGGGDGFATAGRCVLDGGAELLALIGVQAERHLAGRAAVGPGEVDPGRLGPVDAATMRQTREQIACRSVR